MRPAVGPAGAAAKGGAYPAPHRPACAHEGTVAFPIAWRGGGFAIAGGTARSVSPGVADLVFDADGGVYARARRPFVEASEGSAWGGLNAYLRWPEVVRLHWEDFSVPPVGVEFWRALAGMVPTGARVVFCCTGGHGRTGTALAAMLIACGGLSVEEAIRIVRKDYCEGAVETAGQEDYLFRLASACAREASVKGHGATARTAKVRKEVRK